MILVSGGHYAPRPGAHWSGMSEYPETLLWATQIVERLLARDVEALVVPTGRLPEKAAFVNKMALAHPGALAIEVHFNSSTWLRAKGAETLYYPGSRAGEALARRLQTVLARFFTPDRGTKHGWYKMDAPGRVDFPGDVDGDEKIDYWLAKTLCPAVILEPEFIQQPQRIHRHREACCEALAEELAK